MGERGGVDDGGEDAPLPPASPAVVHGCGFGREVREGGGGPRRGGMPAAAAARTCPADELREDLTCAAVGVGGGGMGGAKDAAQAQLGDFRLLNRRRRELRGRGVGVPAGERL